MISSLFNLISWNDFEFDGILWSLCERDDRELYEGHYFLTVRFQSFLLPSGISGRETGTGDGGRGTEAEAEATSRTASSSRLQ